MLRRLSIHGKISQRRGKIGGDKNYPPERRVRYFRYIYSWLGSFTYTQQTAYAAGLPSRGRAYFRMMWLCPGAGA